MSTLHILLPAALIGTELSSWLRANSIEQFDDEQKVYFTPEEIAEFEHESSIKGREMNRLNALLKTVTEAIKKGCEEGLNIDIPATMGTTVLDKQRTQNDDYAEKGYEVEQIRVFGLVDQANETMEYFTAEGAHLAERSRPLTPKEKRTHLLPDVPTVKLQANENF